MMLLRHRFSAMGCPCELAIYLPQGLERTRGVKRKAIIDIALGEIERLEQQYSHYRAESGIKRLQRLARLPWGATPDSETRTMLDFSQVLFNGSGGRFDITAGALTQLWEQADHLPTAAEIRQAQRLCGWHRVYWDGQRLKLPTGMRLNLGGVVKEYAADRTALVLKRHGIQHGYVDLGGDLHVLGPHPDGRPWAVGIRHPRQPGAAARIELTTGGLATSGDYERSRRLGGRDCSHLIDARRGTPVEGLAAVSVLAHSCLVAGGIATVAMLLQPAAGLALLRDSGLKWYAHDGRFSFSGGDGMLQEESVPESTRSFHHESDHRSPPTDWPGPVAHLDRRV